jgi:hypothetical protein
MHTKSMLAAFTTLALTALLSQGQTTGTGIPITNIQKGANTVTLSWPDYTGIVGWKLEATPTLNPPDWQVVDPAAFTTPPTLRIGGSGDYSFDGQPVTLNAAGIETQFFRLYAVKGPGGNTGGGEPFPYTPGTEVTWGQVDHTILINLTNGFKVTWYPKDHSVTNDPASKTHHLYLRRIKGGTFDMGIADGDMGYNATGANVQSCGSGSVGSEPYTRLPGTV